MPDAFLYGSLAPDIVQGRRFQSRLRRHSHNWATGFGLLSAARGSEEQAFALGYLAHLGADVVAHNFYLPTRWIGRFNSAIASHILSEARFDSMHDAVHRETLVRLMAIDFSALDLGPAGRDTKFGYGLVQAKAAVDRIDQRGCGH